jgi:hypothetical protein
MFRSRIAGAAGSVSGIDCSISAFELHRAILAVITGATRFVELAAFGVSMVDDSSNDRFMTIPFRLTAS